MRYWFRKNSARFFASLALLAPQLLFADSETSLDHECALIESAFATNELAKLRDLQPVSNRWQAQRAFRLAAIYIPAGSKPLARRAVRDGLAAVRKGLNAAPSDATRAELLLLGAMLDGQYLLIDRWRLLHNGWRGLRRLRSAERLAPKSARAALIRGTAKVVAPWALGGSPEEAVEILEAVDTTTPLCVDGEWAQVDVLNWLGRAHAKLDQPDQARRYYRAALARSPGNHWVQLALAGEGYEWTEHGEADLEPGSTPSTGNRNPTDAAID